MFGESNILAHSRLQPACQTSQNFVLSPTKRQQTQPPKQQCIANSNTTYSNTHLDLPSYKVLVKSLYNSLYHLISDYINIWFLFNFIFCLNYGRCKWSYWLCLRVHQRWVSDDWFSVKLGVPLSLLCIMMQLNCVAEIESEGWIGRVFKKMRCKVFVIWWQK